MSDEIKLPHHLAEAVCSMEDVCVSEGIGPDLQVVTELMDWIGKTYPDLKTKYSWLPYFREDMKS